MIVIASALAGTHGNIERNIALRVGNVTIQDYQVLALPRLAVTYTPGHFWVEFGIDHMPILDSGLSLVSEGQGGVLLSVPSASAGLGWMPLKGAWINPMFGGEVITSFGDGLDGIAAAALVGADWMIHPHFGVGTKFEAGFGISYGELYDFTALRIEFVSQW